jgi:hypothetical protein
MFEGLNTVSPSPLKNNFNDDDFSKQLRNHDSVSFLQDMNDTYTVSFYLFPCFFCFKIKVKNV